MQIRLDNIDHFFLAFFSSMNFESVHLIISLCTNSKFGGRELKIGGGGYLSASLAAF